MCLICGVENNLGVNAPFYNMEDGSVESVFSFKKEHQSYPGRVHGGMIAAMLDEIIGRALWVKNPNGYGVTMSLNVKYRKVVPYETKLKAVGKITKESDNFFEAQGQIFNTNGELLAEATGRYFKMKLDEIGSINTSDVNVYVEDNLENID